MTGFTPPCSELARPPPSSTRGGSMTAGGRARWTVASGQRQAVSHPIQGASPRALDVWTQPAREGARSLALWLAYLLPLPHLLLLLLLHFSQHLPQSTVQLPPPPVPAPPDPAPLCLTGTARSIRPPACSDSWGTTPPGVCSILRPRGNPATHTARLSGTAGAAQMEEGVEGRAAAAQQEPGLSVRPRCSARAPGAARGRPLLSVRGAPH